MAYRKTLLHFCLCASVLSISMTLLLLSLLMTREETGLGLRGQLQPYRLEKELMNKQHWQREILDLKHERVEKPDYQKTDDPQKPGGSQEGDLQKPGGSQEGDLQKPGGSQEGEQRKPGGSQEGDLQKPGGSQEGEQRKPGGSQEGEQRKPGGSQEGDLQKPGGSQEGEQRKTEAAHPYLDGGETEAVGAQEPLMAVGNCSGPWPDFPNCETKMAWMAKNWKIDECYASFGVDGSRCSFQLYLSEVERWCPRLGNKSPSQNTLREASLAVIQDDIAPLVETLLANRKFDWISRRIQRLWGDWVEAIHRLQREKPFTHAPKTVLVHIGALTDKAGFKFAENADHGGPLGELVQWSDLIASLYLLGHRIEFSTEITQLSRYLLVSKGRGGCPTTSETRYQVIFVDIVGLKQFKRKVGARLQHYRCLFRVLDSFGTEPQFNFKSWKPVPLTQKQEYGKAWGNWDLNPRQFMTMFPHTPDNSFLGFIVENHLLKEEEKGEGVPAKKNQSLVYGKELYMWKDKQKYLGWIHNHFDVHATIGTTQLKAEAIRVEEVVPPFVHNHGILKSTDLQKLLQETRLFVGLGFPYEGPAPLEAIGNGCVYLNPQLNPPLNRENSKFFAKKPTLRALTSQNPYVERFIGRPYVYTVDVGNKTEVEEALKDILRQPPPPPYLPYEFTFEGMLERIAVYLEHQQFCAPGRWPPADVLEARVSRPGESCKDACYREGLVCEPELFPLLNTVEALSKHGLHCLHTDTENSVHGPSMAIDSRLCSLQSETLLLSCVGQSSKMKRLCPCRTYRKGQVALCSTCTR